MLSLLKCEILRFLSELDLHRVIDVENTVAPVWLYICHTYLTFHHFASVYTTCINFVQTVLDDTGPVRRDGFKGLYGGYMW